MKKKSLMDEKRQQAIEAWIQTANIEIYIQNRDIRELEGCCAKTACGIIRKIKKKYDIKDEEMPRKNVIPLSCYEDFHKKRKPKLKKQESIGA